MLTVLADLRSFDEGSILDSDLCVIGAGAAGITLARAFAGRELRVCLVESGGLEPEAATQDLYRGRSVGVRNGPLHASRLRWFGGTTNHWKGWCAALEPIDVAARPWISGSGWPLSLEELEAHYEAAAGLLGVKPVRLDARDGLAREGLPARFDPGRLSLSAWRLDVPPTRFGEVFRSELEKARNVTVLLHANVVNLARSRHRAALSHVEVAALEGRRATVRARCFVLACGGLENPRLLLVSNDVEPSGLGNAHGMVGRFFLDHFHMELGWIHAPGDAMLSLRRQVAPGRAPHHPALRLSDRLQRREAVANSAAYVVRPASPTPTEAKAQEPPGLAERTARMLGELVGGSSGSGQTEGSRPEPQDVLRAYGNPLPDAASRVWLGEGRDALGLPRLELDWRLSERDHRGLATLARAVGSEIARLGAGRLRLSPWLREDHDARASWLEQVRGANHPSGTTRMAADPRHGVTDPDGRVHGVGNLFVAGSSLFPTAGWGNPTLTILALTLRLAQHLGRELGVSPVAIGG